MCIIFVMEITSATVHVVYHHLWIITITEMGLTRHHPSVDPSQPNWVVFILLQILLWYLDPRLTVNYSISFY